MRPTQGTLIGKFVHLAALNCFAIAQPVFERLGNNPQYLRYEEFSGIAVGAVLLLFLFAIPVIVVIVLGVLNFLQFRETSERIFTFVLMMLTTAGFNVAFRQLQSRFDLRTLGVSDLFLLFLSVLLAAICMWLYRTRPWPGKILNLCSSAVVLFPLVLVCQPGIPAEILDWKSPIEKTHRAENPVPVVMVVFDGLCGMALLSAQHKIDAVRYPAFDRLAQRSTFFRNATTVHLRTAQALPAILTGRLPEPSKQSPLESIHPDNLFRMVHDTDQFDMSVFETLTRLCPTDLRRSDESTELNQQMFRLSEALACVYSNMLVPTEFDAICPKIPWIWFGIAERNTSGAVSSKGQITYPWDADRDIQVSHFLRCLQRSEKPGFYFLHMVLPHDPWTYLPSGKHYLKDARVTDLAPGTFGLFGEQWGSDELLVKQGWQRYLLQLQFADRCLGRILDQLEFINEFDRSLVVVVADHGMAFTASEERREPTGSSLPDVMSVPLFVKLPNQALGAISDRNVETVDVVPTISSILGLQGNLPFDGTSLVAPGIPDRPRKQLLLSSGELGIVAPDFSERFGYVNRMVSAFGSGADDRLWSLDTIPELTQIELTSLPSGTPSAWRCRLWNGSGNLDPADCNLVPCFFEGDVIGPRPTAPLQIAIAINGKVVGTTRTSTNPETPKLFAALVKEDAYSGSLNKLQLFEVERTGDDFVLHPIAIDGNSGN